MTVDPACNTLVDETQPVDSVVYRDRRYYFCSAECRAAFERNPSAYVGPRAEPAGVGLAVKGAIARDRQGTARVLMACGFAALCAVLIGLGFFAWPGWTLAVAAALAVLVVVAGRTAVRDKRPRV